MTEENKQPETEKKEEVPQKSSGNNQGQIAVILVRGLVKVTQSVKDTLALMNLKRKNNCVVLVDNSINRGMMKKVKDYATFGIIDAATFKELVEKKGVEYKGRLQDAKGKYSYKTVLINGKHYKPYFRLNPPRKGFGRKGIKMAFKLGGGLGDRGDKINDLIKRMLQ
jgi:large subunit ribosomal protein L30